MLAIGSTKPVVCCCAQAGRGGTGSDWRSPEQTEESGRGGGRVRRVILLHTVAAGTHLLVSYLLALTA